MKPLTSNCCVVSYDDCCFNHLIMQSSNDSKIVHKSIFSDIHFSCMCIKCSKLVG